MTSARLRLDWRPEGTDVVADVELSYTTHGTLAADGANCIVLPTYYTGTADSYLPWIGPGLPFDPEHWYVVVPDMVGNGRSSVRHADGRSWDPRTDPVVRVSDDVALQRRLLEHLGVTRVALVAGWSMGGLQAWGWATAYPELVDAILPVCASARCWPLNEMFLEGLAPLLERALEVPAEEEHWLRVFGRAYAGWAYSLAYFRDGLWRADGYASLEDLRRDWADDHATWSAADLLTMLRTWRSADLVGPEKSWQQALTAVRARAVVMPSTTDAYFTVAENALETACLARGELRPIDSPYGHIAGRPGHLPEVTAAVAAAARELLAPHR
ncbi:homoserine O-acetyltransferase [Motilibacter rhizosphaerae]|uniref:Homoserine O-acetyltransferase n=1 Tax=Motilibacter rhizosphaerae TaxID=598652 RepID=A0A4Q7NUU5_9ACTN|nr:alpha/beta fold hydrolase [Motilibacter rhizosphaerae]RZS90864.1 homoserine O-acetyltransferase [Motilibacter rhizosphaerae]